MPPKSAHLRNALDRWDIFLLKGLDNFFSFDIPLELTLAKMDQISRYNVVHKFQKRSLLIAINCVAGLSILFFG